MSELTQNDKTRNSKFYDFKILGYKKLQKVKVLKSYLTYLKIYEMTSFKYSSLYTWADQLKAAKQNIRDFMI